MFEIIQDAPLVSLVLLAAGVVLGLVAGNFVLPASRRAQRLQGEITQLREDQERYQRRVTEHFQTTAVLVGDLTSSYKAVYEHLASGARTLSDPALSAHGFGAPRLIVDGAEQDRLPQEPIAHDTDPVSEPTPSPVADASEGEAAESRQETGAGASEAKGGASEAAAASSDAAATDTPPTPPERPATASEEATPGR